MTTRLRLKNITFAPCHYLTGTDATDLRDKLVRERDAQCAEIFADHRILSGRGTVAMSLPTGTWSWDFARATDETERRGLDDMINALKRATGRQRFRKRDIIEHDGQLYFRRPALLALASCRDVRASMIRAALALLESLLAQPQLVRGSRCRPHRSLDERKVVNGRRARGLAWTVAEDAELLRTFGVGTDEPRRRLGKRDWQVLLATRLGGDRTRGSVLARVARLRVGNR